MGVNMPPNRLAADLDHILEHTRELWEELRGERLFITGGTGFFGCWLLESFAWANQRLGLKAKALVLSRNPQAFQKKAPHLLQYPDIAFLKGDVKTFAFPVGEFQFAIHAAMETNTHLSNPGALEYFDSAMLGTRRVLDFACSKTVHKLLFTSSGAVYGPQPPAIAALDETYPGAPEPSETRYSYGQGKRAAEFLCCAYSESYGIEVKIARCFAFSGPYLPLDSGFAIGNFIKDAISGKPIRINGDGTPYRSYLYSADLAIWLWTILMRGQSGRPYNVGSENALDILTLAQTVRNTACPNCDIQVASRPPSSHPAQRYVPSTLRARQELGLHEWIGLEEGLRRMVQWNLENVCD
jgi:nucleoside-diphosphate-sugar epimerase